MGVCDCVLEFVNCICVLVFPDEFLVFTSECVERFREVTEVWDEFAIVTKETKEALYFFEVLHGCLPFDDCVHFGVVYGDCAVFDEVSKVFDASLWRSRIWRVCNTICLWLVRRGRVARVRSAFRLWVSR